MLSPYYASLREKVGKSLLLMPAVAGVLRDGAGRLLLQQQHGGAWSLPAGAVEPGETPSAAVCREVREETGLEVRATRILGVVGGPSCRVLYGNGDEVEYVVTVFECEHEGGELLERNDETALLQWFRPEDMPELAFSYPAEILRAGSTTPYFDRSGKLA